MSIKLKGFDEFNLKLKKLPKKMKLSMLIEMEKLALILRARIVQYILHKEHGIDNSPATLLSKHGSTPLVDSGKLISNLSIH